MGVLVKNQTEDDQKRGWIGLIVHHGLDGLKMDPKLVGPLTRCMLTQPLKVAGMHFCDILDGDTKDSFLLRFPAVLANMTSDYRVRVKSHRGKWNSLSMVVQRQCGHILFYEGGSLF